LAVKAIGPAVELVVKAEPPEQDFDFTGFHGPPRKEAIVNETRTKIKPLGIGAHSEELPKPLEGSYHQPSPR